MGHGRVPEKSLGGPRSPRKSPSGVPKVPDEVPRGPESPKKSLGGPESPSRVPPARGERCLSSPSESPPGSRNFLRPRGRGPSRVPLKVLLGPESPSRAPPAWGVVPLASHLCELGCLSGFWLWLCHLWELGCLSGFWLWLCQWNSQQYTGCVNGTVNSTLAVSMGTVNSQVSELTQPEPERVRGNSQVSELTQSTVHWLCQWNSQQCTVCRRGGDYV